MSRWTDGELRAAVRAYLSMLGKQQRNEPYQKADYRRRAVSGPLKARSEASFEYRMRNISAVMEARGAHTLVGYAPANQVGRIMRQRIGHLLDGELQSAATSETPNKVGRPITPLKNQPIIYINIGWMERYRGTAGEAGTKGNHGYLKSHTFGAEAYNFEPVGRRLRGYKPSQGDKGIRLEQLGASRSASELQGALVVWMAKEPVSKRTLIVGWYKNATVYRRPQYVRPVRKVNGERISFSAEAAVEDAHLLPVIARHFEVPSNKQLAGGFGQSTIWYGTNAINRRVRQFVEQVEGGAAKRPSRTSKSPPRNLDPELRRKVERAAVDHATMFYESEEGGGCYVESVEVQARGWDLEVSHPSGRKLLVEVKGLQGPSLRCELTPNEYGKMCHEDHRDDYVIYVVCNALTAPMASVFQFDGAREWVSIDGRQLTIDPRLGAVLSCN